MATLAAAAPVRRETEWSLAVAGAVLVVFLAAAPFALYPVFIMKALCFALFACAFNLVIGYVGLVSFATPCISAGPDISPRMPQRSGDCRRNSRCLPAPRPERRSV